MSPLAEIPQHLILRARAGDAAAFRQLVDLLAGLTFNVAWRLTGHRADAEDMSQEVFLRLHRHFATYDPSLPFLPWFRRLSSNACLNWCRDHRSKRPEQLVDADLPAPETPVPETGVRDAVRSLPEEQRLILARFYFEGLSVAEIAESMDAPVGTIKTWLFRARENLKARLQILKPNKAGEGKRP